MDPLRDPLYHLLTRRVTVDTIPSYEEEQARERDWRRKLKLRTSVFYRVVKVYMMRHEGKTWTQIDDFFFKHLLVQNGVGAKSLLPIQGTCS